MRSYTVRAVIALFTFAVGITLTVLWLTDSRTPRALKTASWALKITTGGGFAGRGDGCVAITSHGDVVADQPSSVSLASCQAEPSSEDLRKRAHLAEEDLLILGQLVSSAEPSAWSENYINPQNPDGCCDQIGTQLELRYHAANGAEHVYTAHWYDSSRYLLPRDLAAIHESAMKIKRKTLKVLNR